MFSCVKIGTGISVELTVPCFLLPMILFHMWGLYGYLIEEKGELWLLSYNLLGYLLGPLPWTFQTFNFSNKGQFLFLVGAHERINLVRNLPYCLQ